MTIETFSMVSAMMRSSQMQPCGLGIPAILAATFAGPFGNSWYSSLMDTPEVLPSTRTVGPVPLAKYSARMNRITCQCALVSSSIPSRRANSGAIASVHCSGWTKNPSLLSSTAVASNVVVDMSLLSDGNRLLAARGHHGPDPGDVPARQQSVPIDGLEQQLAEVVEPRLFEQR